MTAVRTVVLRSGARRKCPRTTEQRERVVSRLDLCGAAAWGGRRPAAIETSRQSRRRGCLPPGAATCPRCSRWPLQRQTSRPGRSGAGRSLHAEAAATRSIRSRSKRKRAESGPMSETQARRRRPVHSDLGERERTAGLAPRGPASSKRASTRWLSGANASVPESAQGRRAPSGGRMPAARRKGARRRLD